MPAELVLVVDDDEGIRDFVSTALSHEGYEVVTAPHGAAALDVITGSRSPSVILLDMRMPVMDGFLAKPFDLDELLRTVARHARHR